MRRCPFIPFSSGVADGAQPLDGDALRRDLTALARSAGGDRAKLRKAALEAVKSAFHASREKVKAGMESGVSPGVAVARALCALQDTTIQVLYDFSVRHFYPAPNPTTSERLAIVATGGYGRGMLAPASDIDLLFIRPFKETAWDQSVIEYILPMLWDMGLKVLGTRPASVAECLRLAKEDITIRTSAAGGALPVGRQALVRRITAKVLEGYCDRERPGIRGCEALPNAMRAICGTARKPRDLKFEPNVKDGKGGLRDLQTLYWIGKYLYRVSDPSDLVAHGVFTKDEYKTFQKAESLSYGRCAAICITFTGRAEERLSFDVQPELAKRLGYTDPILHRAVERFMRSYFLVAKDVG